MSEQTNPSGFPAGLLLAIDHGDRRGLRRQLEQELRLAVRERRLHPGALLPPSRTLAGELGVSRSTVVEAYGQLVAEGYLEAQQGAHTRVRATSSSTVGEPLGTPGAGGAAQFVGGLPDPALFPRREWQRHYRAALSALPDRELGYPSAFGALALRTALADYLGRVRGVVTASDQMVITTGFTQGLALLCRALAARGVGRVAVEDPCFAVHRMVIEAAGLEAVPVAVDDDGIDVAALSDHDVGAVLVSPAHCYPIGAVLGAERRGQLVAWAQRQDALVIEDDYDAEFRYDRAPIGSLQGLAPDRVAYAGCASKTLSPALRLGWVAAPHDVAGELVGQKFVDDMGSPLLEQLAMARLVETGGFARHLRRVRPVYRRRRDATIQALADSIPHATPRGVAAGLHAYLSLPAGVDEAALIAAAHRQGVNIEGAAWHWATPADAPPALVLGYGSLTEPTIRRGIAAVRSALDEVAPGGA